jgi:DNA-binding response OmpR family regulator
MAASGLSRNPDKDRPSDSPFRPEQSANKRPHILIVEDNRADVFLIRSAIITAHLEADVHVVNDGESAVAFFAGRDNDGTLPAPDLVLIDINLPKKHGSEVLMRLRASRRCANAIAIVVTSSDSEGDRKRMTELGANAYFCKPSDYEEFIKLGDLMNKLLSSNNES